MSDDSHFPDEAQFYSDLLRAYFDSANDAIFVLCDEMKFLTCNKMTQEWLGQTEDQLTLHNQRIPVTLLFGYDDATELFTKEFNEAIQGKDVSFETYISPKNGSPRWIEINMTKVDIESGDMVIAVARDISERKRHLAIIEHRSNYDYLTGLPNTDSLIAYLKKRKGENFTTNHSLTLISLNLIKFKEINESFGQKISDDITQEIVNRIQYITESHSGEMLARIGTNDYAIVISDINLADAINISKKIRNLIKSPIEIASKIFITDCNIGISEIPTHTSDSSKLLQFSSAAISSGYANNSRINIYDPKMTIETNKRIQMVVDLGKALKTGDIKPYYQPIINISDPSIIHIEALARWEKTHHDVVSSETFINLAESNHLINILTTQIINQAINECAHLINGGTIKKLSINISPHCLSNTKISNTINAALKQNNVSADCITLEITESTIMSTHSDTNSMIKMLHMSGLNFSIDDFGTGHSSLSKLKQLPLSELKIDKSFILDINTNEDDTAITRASIQMAHSLGLLVVAEGIEQKETWIQLKDFGCDYGQGYWIAKPMPITELEHWLNDYDCEQFI